MSTDEDQTSAIEKQYQRQKYEEIIDVLLSAGYFRARINTLCEFDKVVGGLCWCITSTGEDVDVDILFQENSTIGQRIALSECIVKALRHMKCPFPLQAHQIQGGMSGSDYPAVYLVIVWLIKKFIERRSENEDQLRSFALRQFLKSYKFPDDQRKEVPLSITNLIDSDKVTRCFRRKAAKGESEERKVISCLIEYGETFTNATQSGRGHASGRRKKKKNVEDNDDGPEEHSVIRVNLDVAQMSLIALTGQGTTAELTGFEKKLAQAAKDAEREEQLAQEEAIKQEAELLGQMEERNDDSAVSGSQIGAIVGLSSDAIGSANATYLAQVEETRRLLESTMAAGKLGQVAHYKRQREQLLQIRDDMDAQVLQKQAVVDAMSARLAALEEEKNGTMVYLAQLSAQMEKLQEIEKQSHQKEELAMLKKLIALNETLKRQEAEFKASCKSQLQELEENVKALEQAVGEDNEDSRRLREIEEMHQQISLKHSKMRQLLAESNREVAEKIRVIDDVPTRTELIQYERRFGELDRQVKWKKDEIKKYSALYSILETKLAFLQKHVKTLNSISESFASMAATPKGKGDFLHRLQGLVAETDEARAIQESIVSDKNQLIESMKVEHQNLVDTQRRYFKAVKELQEECSKNEWLMAQLEQRSPGAQE